MTSMLPPTRDLPPGRHTQIRAELERAVSGRASKRYLVPILAGVTAVAAVVGGVVVLKPNANPTPAGQITTSPSPTPAVRDTFGLSPERIATIEQGCAKQAKVTDKLTMYQYGRDDTGQWAYLYTDKVRVSCDIGRGNKEYSGGQQPLYIGWLAGHFSLDTGGSMPGGDSHPFYPGMAGVPGYYIMAGRVDSSVARVTYRGQDGRTAEAKIANGTFVVRMAYPSTWDGNAGTGSSATKFYDAAGNLIGESGESEKCWTMPGQNETLPDHRPVELAETGGNKCQPAPPWKFLVK